ncbi:MAG: beta-class carbonic anhydrase [Arachnia sp.]
MSFDDLLAANRAYAEGFTDGGFDGIARRGVLIITCMDSRIEPLAMTGLRLGDAKILRTPGGQVSSSVINGAILSVALLNVTRIMVVPHTRCVMASGTDDDIRATITQRTGSETEWLSFGATPDQLSQLRRDVAMVAAHPLITGRAEVGGFMYDVDTGLLERLI